VARDEDSVRSAETSMVPTGAVLDAHSRPTTALDSGERDAPTLISGPQPTVGTPRAAAKPVWQRTSVLAGAGALAVIAVVAIALSGGDSVPAPTAPPADSIAAAAPSPEPAPPPAAAGSDSIATGHGPDSAGTFRGRPFRSVTGDAIALLQPSLAGDRLSIGDTVRVRLIATDDNGERVTSPDITWTASNPRVAKLAGAGFVVGVSEGRATITVTAGTTTNTLVVAVTPRGRGATRQKKQP